MQNMLHAFSQVYRIFKWSKLVHISLEAIKRLASELLRYTICKVGFVHRLQKWICIEYRIIGNTFAVPVKACTRWRLWIINNFHERLFKNHQNWSMLWDNRGIYVNMWNEMHVSRINIAFWRNQINPSFWHLYVLCYSL